MNFTHYFTNISFIQIDIFIVCILRVCYSIVLRRTYIDLETLQSINKAFKNKDLLILQKNDIPSWLERSVHTKKVVGLLLFRYHMIAIPYNIRVFILSYYQYLY